MLPHIFSAESKTFVELRPKVLLIAEEIDILLNSSSTRRFQLEPFYYTTFKTPCLLRLQNSVTLAEEIRVFKKVAKNLGSLTF